MTVTGAVIAGGSYAINKAVMSGNHVSIPVGDGATARLLVSTALLLPLCALGGMALGTVIRNTPATVVAVCVLFVFTPFIFKSATTGSRVADIRDSSSPTRKGIVKYQTFELDAD
jgi:hypothetical protein